MSEPTPDMREAIADAIRCAVQGFDAAGIALLVERFPDIDRYARMLHWAGSDGRPPCGAGPNVLTTGDAGLSDCPACREAFRARYGVLPTV